MTHKAEHTSPKTTSTAAEIGGQIVDTTSELDEGIEAALRMYNEEPPADEPPADEPPADEPPAEQEGGEEEPPADEPPADEPPAEQEGGEEEPPADEPPADELPSQPQDIGQVIADAIREARQEPAKAPVAEPEEDEEDIPVTPEDFMSDDERKYLQKYDEEWGDVSKAEAIRTRAAVEHARHELQQEVVRVLAPMVQRLNSLQVNQQLTAIRAVHPDYDTVIQEVPAWIEKQPELYRGALADVLRKGSVQQVVELVSAYKQATGKTSTAPATPVSSATQQQQPTAQKPVVRKAPASPPPAAVAATAGVPSERSAPIERNADDFEGAVADALRSI